MHFHQVAEFIESLLKVHIKANSVTVARVVNIINSQKYLDNAQFNIILFLPKSKFFLTLGTIVKHGLL